MASGDFLDLAEWAARSARFDTATAADMTLAKQAINTAYLSTCDSGDPFRFLQQEGQWTTVAGDDVYTYTSIATAMGVASSAAIREVVAITSDDDGHWIKGSSWEDLERWSHSTQDDANDLSFRFSSFGGDRIRLYPTPDETITIGCLAILKPANMTSDADTPLIPLTWRHRLLVPYAAAMLLRTEGGLETASEAERLMARYDDDFIKFRGAYATAQRPQFNVASPGWETNDPVGSPWSWGDW